MTIRLVIVEDHEALRRLTQLWIDGDPRFEVVGEAATGLAGIEVVTAEQPDVVLLDIAMPQMDGLSSIPFLRSAAPRSMIVVYTNHEEYGRLAVKRGAAAVFEKSESLPDVLERIVQLLADAAG